MVIARSHVQLVLFFVFLFSFDAVSLGHASSAASLRSPSSPCLVRNQKQFEACLQSESQLHVQLLSPARYRLPDGQVPARPLLIEGMGTAESFLLQGSLRVDISSAAEHERIASATAASPVSWSASLPSQTLLALRNLTFEAPPAESLGATRPLVHVSAPTTGVHLAVLTVSMQWCSFRGGLSAAQPASAAQLLVEGALVAELRDSSFRHAVGPAVVLRNSHATSPHLLLGVLFEENRSPAAAAQQSDAIDLLLVEASAQLVGCRFLGGRCEREAAATPAPSWFPSLLQSPSPHTAPSLPPALRQRVSARGGTSTAAHHHLEVSQCTFGDYGTAQQPCGSLLHQSGSDAPLTVSDSDFLLLHAEDQPAIYTEASLALLRHVSLQRVQCSSAACVWALVCTGNLELDSCSLLGSLADVAAVSVFGDTLTLSGEVTVRGHILMEEGGPAAALVRTVQTRGADAAATVYGSLIVSAAQEVHLQGDHSSALVTVAALELSAPLRILKHSWQINSLLAKGSDVHLSSEASLRVAIGSVNSLLIEQSCTLLILRGLSVVGPAVLDGTLTVNLASTDMATAKLSAANVVVGQGAVLTYQFNHPDYVPAQPDIYQVIESDRVIHGTFSQVLSSEVSHVDMQMIATAPKTNDDHRAQYLQYSIATTPKIVSLRYVPMCGDHHVSDAEECDPPKLGSCTILCMKTSTSSESTTPSWWEDSDSDAHHLHTRAPPMMGPMPPGPPMMGPMPPMMGPMPPGPPMGGPLPTPPPGAPPAGSQDVLFSEFLPSMSGIKVGFAFPFPPSITCYSVLLTPQKFGTGFTCFWHAPGVLQVEFGPGATLVPGDLLTYFLNPGQVTVSVVGPMMPPSPELRINGPPSIIACDESVVLRAEGGVIAGQLPTFAWSLGSSTGSAAQVSALQSALTAAGSSGQITLAASLFVDGLSYQIALTASYAVDLDVPDAVFTHTMTAALSADLVVWIEGPSPRPAPLERATPLDARVRLCNLAAGTTLQYAWEMRNPQDAVVWTLAGSATRFAEAPGVSEEGEYTVTVTAWPSTGDRDTDSVQASLVLQVSGAAGNFAVFVRGGSRTVVLNGLTTIAAGTTLEGTPADRDILYSWQCTALTTGACPSTLPTQPRFELDTSTLGEGEFTFTVTATLGMSDAVQASVTLTVLDAPLPTVLVDGPPFISLGQRLLVDGRCFPFGADVARGGADPQLLGLQVLWSAPDQDLDLGDSTVSDSALDAPTLVINAGALASSASYTFRFSCLDELTMETGWAEHTVEVLQPPSGGTCTVSPTVVSQVDSVTITCEGYSASDGSTALEYRFGVFPDPERASALPAPPRRRDVRNGQQFGSYQPLSFAPTTRSELITTLPPGLGLGETLVVAVDIRSVQGGTARWLSEPVTVTSLTLEQFLAMLSDLMAAATQAAADGDTETLFQVLATLTQGINLPGVSADIFNEVRDFVLPLLLEAEAEHELSGDALVRVVLMITQLLTEEVGLSEETTTELADLCLRVTERALLLLAEDESLPDSYSGAALACVGQLLTSWQALGGGNAVAQYTTPALFNIAEEVISQLGCGEEAAEVFSDVLNLWTRKASGDAGFSGQAQAFNDTLASFLMPSNLAAQLNASGECLQGIMFSTPENPFSWAVGQLAVGDVVSFDFRDANGTALSVEQLDDGILITIPWSEESGENPDAVCAWWNPAIPSWDTFGCEEYDRNATALYCSCTHLTSFSALLTGGQDGSSWTTLDTVSAALLGGTIVLCLLFVLLAVYVKPIRRLVYGQEGARVLRTRAATQSSKRRSTNFGKNAVNSHSGNNTTASSTFSAGSRSSVLLDSSAIDTSASVVLDQAA